MVASRLFYGERSAREGIWMLSIQNSSNAAWRTSFLQILPNGTDLDNESEIRQAFDDGMQWADTTRKAWARSKKNEEGYILLRSPYGSCLEHKSMPAKYFADQYLRTLRDDGIPVIPKFMRAYCAQMKGLQVSDSRVPSELAPISQNRQPERNLPPPVLMRTAPAY